MNKRPGDEMSLLQYVLGIVLWCVICAGAMQALGGAHGSVYDRDEGYQARGDR